MKKVRISWLLIMCVVLFLSACSASDSVENQAVSDHQIEIGSSADAVATESETEENRQDDSNGKTSTVEESPSSRMIIHQAYLQLHVENFENARVNIEKKVDKYNGYVVSSDVYYDDNETISGNMIIRIPEKHFQSFLSDAENVAAHTISRNVTGEDVTEQYVDLSSRLKSKRAVEERLLDFMKQAEKTEDLLNISSDLAVVQEEIEVIVGKMNYLENQTAYSTIEMNMTENRIVIPGIDGKGLNTWEKTKKQFTTSLNLVLAFGSNLVIFFVGNIPAILIILLIAGGAYLLMRKKINRK